MSVDAAVCPHRRQARHERISIAARGSGAVRSSPSTGSGEEPLGFAVYAAHELRTPLATQRALLEVALANPDADLGTWRDVGINLLHACDQQERLLEACLLLADCHRGVERRGLVELGAIVADLIQHSDLQGLTAHCRLEHSLAAGDRILIERLVANLVANAIRHNRPGGWIRIATRSVDDRALLTIENTGTSVHADEIAQLFKPFREVKWRHNSSRGGLGLGLTLVRAVADANHAAIAAHPRDDGGLRINVTFRARARGPQHHSL